MCKDSSLESLSSILTAKTEEEEDGESWGNFPKGDTFPRSSRGVRRGTSFLFSPSSLCSSAPAWPSPRKWVTPKLAECLVGTKINLPPLSSPPLASVPSVLALISSPEDESLSSWRGRLHRAQLSFDSCPEPYRQRYCVHMWGVHCCISGRLHVSAAEKSAGDSVACWHVTMHIREVYI